MTWDATKPSGSLPASQGGADIRTNNAHLEAAVAGEHDFPGSSTPGVRRHKFPRLDAAGRAALTGQVAGTLAFRTDRKQIDVYNGTGWDEYAAAGAGDVKMYAGVSGTIPGGWLECNGAEVSKTTYAALWTAFGSTHLYGTPGDPTNNFLLPNMKGRFPAGYDSGDADYNTVGKTGGEKKHAIAAAELPAMASSGTHGHAVPGSADAALLVPSGSNQAATKDHTHTISGDGAHTHTYTGTGDEHENRPPYVTFLFLIKT